MTYIAFAVLNLLLRFRLFLFKNASFEKCIDLCFVNLEFKKLPLNEHQYF